MNNTLVRSNNLLGQTPTDVLKESARKLVAMTGEDATEAFHAVMVKLEGRLSQNSYIEFCLSLEEYINA